MKILHLNDPARVAYTLAHNQREMGHEAQVLRLAGLGPLGWTGKLLRNQSVFRDADIVHAHGGIRLSQFLLSCFREKLVVHFHGSDARLGGAMHHLRFARRRIVSTPDLLNLVPDSIWIPNPLAIPCREPPYTKEGLVLVGHFPTNPSMKGTALIQRALNGMHTAALKVFHGRDHTSALDAMENCDIVIDQLMPYGVYGTVTLEAMAMGKPVICSLNPALYPETPPIVAMDPDALSPKELRSAILDLIETREHWPDWRITGRRWLETYHNSRTITEKVLHIYSRALCNS